MNKFQIFELEKTASRVAWPYLKEEEGMISEYELKRKANIERNNDYLQSLGINTTSKRHHSKSTPRNSNGNVSEKKRKLLEPVIGQRKSSRLADKDPVNYKEVIFRIIKLNMFLFFIGFVAQRVHGNFKYCDKRRPSCWNI